MCPGMTTPSGLTYDDMRVVPVLPALRLGQSRSSSGTSGRFFETLSIRRILYGVRRYVAVSLLTLSVFRLPQPCWSAPMDRPDTSSTGQRRGDRPLWINPCGIDTGAALEVNTDDGLPMTFDRVIIENVLHRAWKAFYHTKDFRDNYVQQTFKVSFDEHHETWASSRYDDWLPSREEIPKDLGAQLTPEQLQGLQLGPTLQRVYEALQKFAVGLEQVVMDQGVYDGNFVNDFNESQYNLKGLLCELQIAMTEKNVEPLPDVARHIMEQKVRDIDDDSLRNLRDWIIFRDYMNSLEYTIQVFQYFQSQLDADCPNSS